MMMMKSHSLRKAEGAKWMDGTQMSKLKWSKVAQGAVLDHATFDHGHLHFRVERRAHARRPKGIRPSRFRGNSIYQLYRRSKRSKRRTVRSRSIRPRDFAAFTDLVVSEFAFKNCVYLRCIPSHVKYMTLDTPRGYTEDNTQPGKIRTPNA